MGKGNVLYVSYMDLDKAYDRIDSDAMWRVLIIHGINGSLLKGIQNLYVESEVCVMVCRKDGKGRTSAKILGLADVDLNITKC